MFLLPLIKLYKSEVEQSVYLNRLALEIKTDVRLLWNDLKKIKNKNYPGVKIHKTGEPPPQSCANGTGGMSDSEKKRIFSREEFMLGLIFSYPEIYPEVANNLIDNIQIDSDTENFYNSLKKVYTLKSSIDIDSVKKELNEEDQDK